MASKLFSCPFVMSQQNGHIQSHVVFASKHLHSDSSAQNHNYDI